MSPTPVRRLTKPTNSKPAPAPVARKAAPAPVVEPEDEDLEEMEGDEDEDEDEDDDVSEEVFTDEKRVTRRMPIPTAPAKPAAKPGGVKKFAPGPDLNKAVAEEVVALSTNPIEEILEHMRSGESVLIEKVGKSFQLTYGKAVAAAITDKIASKGRVNRLSLEDEILSEGYKTWQADWKQLSTEDKFKKIKAAKVTWEEHADPATNLMRAVSAYQAHLGIEKYKPEYATLASRKTARKNFTN